MPVLTAENAGIVLIRSGVVVSGRGRGRALIGWRYPVDLVATKYLGSMIRTTRRATRTGLPQHVVYRSARTGELVGGYLLALSRRTLLGHGRVIDDSFRLVRLVRPPPDWHPTHDLDMPAAWTEVEPPRWRDVNWAMAFNAASRTEGGRLWAVVEKHLHHDTRRGPKPPESAPPRQPR